MLKITKRQTESGYHFIIENCENAFVISFGGNGDLYWYQRCSNKSNDSKELSCKSFIIDKENYFLFSLVETLYNDVKDCKVFEMDEANDQLKRHQEDNKERLFKEGTIEWHCDDSNYDEASVLKIEKKEEAFLITMEKSKVENTYAVRIRNRRSRYNPFNILFMKMYEQLIQYDNDYQQIHMEEYLYQKKLEKKLR
ncbi:MAG: hypothetical protein PHN72_05885 [Bacilli bacterium]|nr:hypothetical protein [Bacilli bacterium]